MDVAIDYGRHRQLVRFEGVAPDVAALVPLRIDAYLRPHLQRFAERLEQTLGHSLPPTVGVRLIGAPGWVRVPERWHLYLLHGDHSGLRTVERILVQVAAAAVGSDSVRYP